METSQLDRGIETAEKRVLLMQERIISARENVNSLIDKLEAESTDVFEMKNEWLKRRNDEDERSNLELQQIKLGHRHDMEDLRLKYEAERNERLREVKMLIGEKEREIEEWKRRRDEAAMKTQAEESRIRSKYQDKIQNVIRAEQSTQRRGVVDRSRLATLGNIFSMEMNPSRHRDRLGMKRSKFH